jgi:hypothetical protein
MSRDDRDIWFPAKRYGWGWGLPVTWQGWAVMAAYFVVLLIGFFGIDPERQLPLFMAWMLGWSAVLIAVCWWKGERPRWRWGGRD